MLTWGSALAVTWSSGACAEFVCLYNLVFTDCSAFVVLFVAFMCVSCFGYIVDVLLLVVGIRGEGEEDLPDILTTPSPEGKGTKNTMTMLGTYLDRQIVGLESCR